MQKITRSLVEHLKPVRLYLDDIGQIVEILHDVSSDVSISTNDYALNDIKQLVDLKKEFITDFHIQIREPYVSLSLEHHQISFYAAKDDAISRGIFEKVKRVLSRNKRPLSQILQNSLLAGLIMGISFPMLAIGLAKTDSTLIFSSVLIFILSLGWAWYGYQDRFKRYSIIIPKYRIEMPSFWKRNSDALVLAIFSAVAGGIITLLLAKLFGIMP